MSVREPVLMTHAIVHVWDTAAVAPESHDEDCPAFSVSYINPIS